MTIKRVDSPEYHSVFNSETGFFARWGKTYDDDPEMSVLGPELMDIEISTVCNGFGKSMETRKPCSWCYKSNTEIGDNMSIETFTHIASMFPPTVNQIAFGIGDIDSCPDLWKIMEYCRARGIVPNLTTNGMGIEGEVAQRLANTMGAVAVSHYGDDLCFNAVKALTDAGLKQVNIHKLISQETLASCFNIIDKAATDIRLSKLKAIVFLLLKPKGDRNQLTPVKEMASYQKLMNYARERGVSVGMDSCSAPMALQTLPEECVASIEPCESSLFSMYVSVKGEVFPCSFTEGLPGWESGIPMTEINDFKDVWYHPRLTVWREALLNSSKGCTSCGHSKHCRSCPIYDISICNPKPELNRSSMKLVTIGKMR